MIRSYFAPGGTLARHVDGYAPREVQATMAEHVADAMSAGETLVIEAGTGTGKTFAYLVPALVARRRIVISTGTLNLQDQLFYRDLPRVRAALDVPVTTALLKGRANYLCRYRFDRAQQQPAGPREAAVLHDLRAWARGTESGELQEVAGLAEDDPLLPRVTSTAENCLGSRCPDYEGCFVVRARRRAQSADVVVVNHHLLFADFIVKEEGFGEILPGADAVIVDEAHQLPELATRFFGVRVSTRQMQEVAADAAAEADVLGDVPQLRKQAAALADALALLEPCFAGVGGRERLGAFLERGKAAEHLEATRRELADLGGELKALAGRTPGLATCSERCQAIEQRFEVLTRSDGEVRIAWVEAAGRGGAFNSTPVRLDPDFQRMRELHGGAWVFTSATLAAQEDFSHFCGQLGLADARTARLDSPFDYRRQCRLYLPADLPEPNTPGYTQKVADTLIPVVKASGGGAFILCTSHRALREIAERVRAELELPVWVQGEGSRTELLDAFTRSGNGVLVGTSSFWEGVDVRGSALRVVAIDRLPFAAPGDPVFEARLSAIRQAGGDPFRDYQLPQAIVTLRQGVGRLIRDPGDRGLLVLCDPRLRTRPYGRRMLASLPRMPVLSEPDEVRAWLGEIRDAA